MSIKAFNLNEYDSDTGQKVIKLFQKVQKKIEKENQLQKERKDPRLTEHDEEPTTTP